MASYQFRDRVTEQTVNLDEVDRIICEREGLQVQESRFSQAYSFLVDFGFTVLMSKGGGSVGDKPEHREFIENECFSESQGHSKALALWAFYEKFEFCAWR